MDPSLHCSVIGTCLVAAELRGLLKRLGVAGAESLSDHELHGKGVALAGDSATSGKLLHKALDRRHQNAVARFARARSADEVMALWQEDLAQGDIPGAYWAALTHPQADPALTRAIFGEVHMLSHLVGAANRADIRRLRDLERENADLRDKIDRQQARLRDLAVARDATRQALDLAEAARAVAATAAAEAPVERGEAERALDAETRKRAWAEQALAQARRDLAAARRAESAASRRERDLRLELDAANAALAIAGDAAPAETGAAAATGETILYVGGRESAIPHMRAWIARRGGTLLHHDGGVDDREGLLAGLVSRADLVLFPVDCISHAAVATVKRLCVQMAKPYVPLRSAGIASLIAALGVAAAAPVLAEASD
ncbi:MAG: DUF2325 domain-containing protein [Alphaproteobacteria bacterium]|nr:DUF2325 domain-containing protein [Alphaproteobacteria bacterium]